MYFNNVAEKLNECPDYIIEYMLKFKNYVKSNAKRDFRKIMGEETLIIAFKDMTTEIKEYIDFIQHYIMSQQFSILKDKVPYERSVCIVQKLYDSTNVPNRYINRIGENIVLVVEGTCTFQSSEFSESVTINSGEIYRYNSRIPMNYTYSDNFYAVLITYVDFDLTHYLMPYDVHGVMPRRRDEYADYDPNDTSHKLDNVSTNDY